MKNIIKIFALLMILVIPTMLYSQNLGDRINTRYYERDDYRHSRQINESSDYEIGRYYKNLESRIEGKISSINYGSRYFKLTPDYGKSYTIYVVNNDIKIANRRINFSDLKKNDIVVVFGIPNRSNEVDARIIHKVYGNDQRYGNNYYDYNREYVKINGEIDSLSVVDGKIIIYRFTKRIVVNVYKETKVYDVYGNRITLSRINKDGKISVAGYMVNDRIDADEVRQIK